MEYYKGKFYDAVPSKQGVSYRESRSGRTCSRTISVGVTQPLQRDPRDPSTYGGGTSPVMPIPSRTNNTYFS